MSTVIEHCIYCNEELTDTEYECCEDCYNDRVCLHCGEFYNSLENGYCPDCGICEECGAEDYLNRNNLCDDCERLANIPGTIEDMASDVAERGISWKVWEELAELSSNIEFGCNFDSNGKCACTRHKDSSWDTERACCADCAFNIGYLQFVPIEAVKMIAALYDGKTGFWSPAGCKLPRKYRSRICLSYCCNHAQNSKNHDSAGYKQFAELLWDRE